MLRLKVFWIVIDDVFIYFGRKTEMLIAGHPRIYRDNRLRGDAQTVRAVLIHRGVLNV